MSHHLHSWTISCTSDSLLSRNDFQKNVSYTFMLSKGSFQICSGLGYMAFVFCHAVIYCSCFKAVILKLEQMCRMRTGNQILTWTSNVRPNLSRPFLRVLNEEMRHFSKRERIITHKMTLFLTQCKNAHFLSVFQFLAIIDGKTLHFSACALHFDSLTNIYFETVAIELIYT